MEILSSRANPRIRHAARLRTGRYRRNADQFVVDGRREIERAINAGVTLVELFVEVSSWADLEAQSIAAPGAWLNSAQSAGKITLVAATAFKKLAYGERNEALVAVFETPSRSLDQLPLSDSPLLMVADRIEKPGNLGALFRSADAAGVEALICSDCATDVFHPNVIRASLGTVFSLPTASCDASAAQTFLRDAGVRCVAARVDATCSLWDSELSGALALVVGAEAEGLGDNWNIEAISIPMAGRADSLNVSVAAAVLAFEARRQRSLQSDYRKERQNR